MPTVLIVDDDKHVRSVIERMCRLSAALRPYDLKYVQAADGEQGLQVLDQERPDVVICDLLMPRLDGWGFCKALRERPHGKGLGLIVVSGLHRERGVAEQVQEEFGGLFFAKPNELGELPGALERILAARLAQAGAAAPRPPSAPPVRASLGPMEGRLAEKGLPVLLLELYEGAATGVVELRRGRMEKRIDLLDGHPVTTFSNQRNETLGHFLVEKNVITPRQHQQALGRAVGSGARVGEHLVEMGVLSAAKLITYLQMQARHKITQALRWPDGTWSYRPSTDILDRAKAQALDGPGVVFWGLRESAAVEEAAHTCEKLDGRKVTLTPRGLKLLGPFGRAFGDALGQAIADGGASVEDLLALKFDVARVLTAVEALLLTGCCQPVGTLAVVAPPKKRPTVDPIALDVLSDASRSLPPPLPPTGPTLYDVLFGDVPELELHPPEPLLIVFDDGVPMADLGIPESGVVDLSEEYGMAAQMRDELLLELLRLQGKDWYAVLQIPHGADGATVEAAFAERTAAFALERYSTVDVGRDYGRLEDLHVAYRRAREVLTDPARRAEYDRQIGAGLPGRREAIDADIHYHRGEELLAKGGEPSPEDLDQAIQAYEAAVHGRPDSSDYHAALGWALHRRSRGRSPAPESDAASASAHLAQALAIDPDHAAAHAFTGQMLAAREVEPERALLHLERALDLQPPRFDALPALEALRRRRGELRELELAYRKLIHSVGTDREQALRLWLSLATLYRDHLDDRDAARVAYQCALRLEPSDAKILAALDELTAGVPGRFADRAEALRGRFRLDHASAAPLVEMIRAAKQAQHLDAAFVAAGVLCARELADPESLAFYQQHRPTGPFRARSSFEESHWERVRHADDNPEVGALFALLEQVAAEVSPLSLAALGVTDDHRVPAELVPESLAAVRRYAAGMLGVDVPEIYLHRDFGDQVHIGALNPPILLTGPQALAQEDRIELAFWVGRAMTFVRPGRAVGGSRPGRVLKALLSAALSFTPSGVSVPDPDGLVARAREYLAGAPEEYRDLVSDLVGRVTYGRDSINLSGWARALGRTADRVGLLVCGDPAVAARAAASLLSREALDDLLDFALSADHLAARRSLGLSVDA